MPSSNDFDIGKTNGGATPREIIRRRTRASSIDASSPQLPRSMNDMPKLDLTLATREQLLQRIELLGKLCMDYENQIRALVNRSAGDQPTTRAVRRPLVDIPPDVKVLNNQEMLKAVALEAFTRFPLFQDFPQEALEKLASNLAQITKVKESVVVKKGDAAMEMFFIFRGSVGVCKDNGDLIATLEEDSFFGEIGVLFNEKRTATVKVMSEECTLLMLTRKAMERSLEKYPDLMLRIKEAATDRNAWLQKLKYILDTSAVEFGGEFVADVGRMDLHKILLFENADTDFLDELSRKLLPEIYHDGQLVVKRGEMANEMYLILTGAVEVVSDDLKSVYATITQGSFFGEVGILLKTTRTASVRAKGSVTLLKLTRDDLQTVTKKFPKIENDLKVAAEERYNLFKLRTSPQNEFEFEVNQQNLSKVAIFAKCDREVLNAIASVMTTTKFKKGENIVHCGQKAEEMFFLTHGEADIISEFGDIIDTSGTGSFFGEVGILHNLPRIATVRAKTDCVAHVLTRNNLVSCLQKFPDALEEIKVESSNRLQSYLMRNVLA